MSTQPQTARPLSAVVGDNIRAEAARRRLSQGRLAGLLGMSRQAVSDRYQGRARWQLDEVEAVAARFGVPLTSLLSEPSLLPRLDSNQQPADYRHIRLICA